MENGRVVAQQAWHSLEKLFQNVRADIIAEHFSKEHNAAMLFNVAKELDDRAHTVNPSTVQTLSNEAKSVLGVFCDFVQAKRATLFNGSTGETPHERAVTLGPQAADGDSKGGDSKEALERAPDGDQSRLL